MLEYNYQLTLCDCNAKCPQMTQRKIEIGINIFPIIFRLKASWYVLFILIEQLTVKFGD